MAKTLRNRRHVVLEMDDDGDEVYTISPGYDSYAKADAVMDTKKHKIIVEATLTKGAKDQKKSSKKKCS